VKYDDDDDDDDNNNNNNNNVCFITVTDNALTDQSRTKNKLPRWTLTV